MCGKCETFKGKQSCSKITNGTNEEKKATKKQDKFLMFSSNSCFLFIIIATTNCERKDKKMQWSWQAKNILIN